MLLLDIGLRSCDRDRMAYPFVPSVNVPPRPANSNAGQSVLSVLLNSFEAQQTFPNRCFGCPRDLIHRISTHPNSYFRAGFISMDVNLSSLG